MRRSNRKSPSWTKPDRLGRRFALGLLAVCSGSLATDFERDIKPIFTEHCYSCHGPEKHQGGLRLDRKADALKGSDFRLTDVAGKVVDKLVA